MMPTRLRLDPAEGFHNHCPGRWGRRMLMTRIPHIPAAVTALMAAVVFMTPRVVMLGLRSPS